MNDLHKRGVRIDRVTIADELMKQGQLESVGGLSYLISLDEGMPEIANLDGYIRIVKDKATLRGIIINAQMATDQALLGAIEPAEIVDAQLAHYETLRASRQSDKQIRRVEDLESIFAGDRQPTKYLIEPAVPEKALVVLVGSSEAGKTTLACAWAEWRRSLSRSQAPIPHPLLHPRLRPSLRFAPLLKREVCRRYTGSGVTGGCLSCSRRSISCITVSLLASIKARREPSSAGSSVGMRPARAASRAAMQSGKLSLYSRKRRITSLVSFLYTSTTFQSCPGLGKDTPARKMWGLFL